MQDLRGKVVLLDFWASYCGPCLEAMPELQGLLERRRSQGLEVLGVGLESSEGLAAEFLRAAGVRYPSVLDVDGAVSRSYGVRGLPTAILIGKDGSVRRVWTGYEPGLIQEIDAAASALLEEGTVRGG
jgi:thiol-disulfide isomerase/thioredoxin